MTRSILLIVSALNGNVTTGRALFIAICERRVTYGVHLRFVDGSRGFH